jgi:hypothetical protein
MAIDWPTVITSGSVSALVGGVVSMMTARRVAAQQVAGRTTAEARQRVRELVSPELTKLRQFQAHGYASLQRDEDNLMHADDIVLCGNLFAASADLTAWRRRLVRRRLRKLFGANTVGFCETHGADAADPRKSFAVLLQRQALGVMRPEHGLPHPDTGKFDAAFRAGPASKEVTELIRSLGCLARSW